MTNVTRFEQPGELLRVRNLKTTYEDALCKIADGGKLSVEQLRDIACAALGINRKSKD